MLFHFSNSIDRIRKLRLFAIAPVLLAGEYRCFFNVSFVDPNAYDVLVSGRDSRSTGVCDDFCAWRLLAGMLVGIFLMSTIGNWLGGGILDLPSYGHVMFGSFAFVAVFIASDPSSSSSTNSGRWIQGVLAGVLLVFMRAVNPSHPDGVISVLRWFVRYWCRSPQCHCDLII